MHAFLTHGAHRVTVVAVVVVPVRIPGVEVQVVRVVRVALVERRRPVVAVRARVVELTIPAVACGGKEETVRPAKCFMRRQPADTDGS